MKYEINHKYFLFFYDFSYILLLNLQFYFYLCLIFSKNSFNILSQVYEEAYKIYDFRNSGKKDFVPDIELIKKLDREFCEPMKKRRPVF